MEKIKQNVIFYVDLIKWIFVILLIIVWSLIIIFTLSILKFLDKLPEKIQRKKFLLQVQILKILEKVLTFFKK